MEVTGVRLVEGTEALERVDTDVHRRRLGRQRSRDGGYEALDRVARRVEHRLERALDMTGESGIAAIDGRSEDRGEVGGVVTRVVGQTTKFVRNS